MNKTQLIQDIERDEGVRLKPYVDSVGKLTIGIGRNLDDVGLSIEEARFLLSNDIEGALRDLDRNIPWWRNMTEGRQRALANMCFNMGWPTLSHFRNMLGALEAGNYADAAREAMDSKWARQVGQRARRIALLLKEGE